MFAVKVFRVIIPRTIKEGRSSARLSRVPDCLDTGKTYQWDAEGRMKTVTPYGGSASNYVYNALGQRVEKYTGTAYTEIAYDAFGNQIGTHNQTTWGTYFVPLGGRTLVRYQDNKTYFLHPNHLGSTAFVTDETGATIQKTIYYPWGQTWASSATVKDSRFASMDPRDSETANDPTLFRMYQPRLYRWLSPDPVAGDISNPQSLNRYAYVLNNPTNLIDPLGLDGCEVTHNPLDCKPPWAGPPPGAGGSPYGGDGGFNTNPVVFSCAYIGHYSAQCDLPPGLWPNGTPIFSSGSSTDFGGIGGGVTGWNPNSPPINLPPPSLPGWNPQCDWSCGGPDWSGAAGYVSGPRLAPIPYGPDIFYFYVDVWERINPPTELWALWRAGQIAAPVAHPAMPFVWYGSATVAAVGFGAGLEIISNNPILRIGYGWTKDGRRIFRIASGGRWFKGGRKLPWHKHFPWW